MRLLLRPKFQYAWSSTVGWACVASMAAGLVLLALLIERLAHRSTMSFEVWGFLLMVCGGTFAALLLSGSVLLGQFAVVLGAAIFGTLILTIRRGGLDPESFRSLSCWKGRSLSAVTSSPLFPLLAPCCWLLLPCPLLSPSSCQGGF